MNFKVSEYMFPVFPVGQKNIKFIFKNLYKFIQVSKNSNIIHLYYQIYVLYNYEF